MMGIKQRFQNTVLELAVADDGMSTAEYAIGTIAAAAFGAVLYTVVTGPCPPRRGAWRRDGGGGDRLGVADGPR